MGILIKKFQAPTLQEAIQKIRDHLGDHAIILQTDPIKSSFLGKNQVEVTAAIEQSDGREAWHASKHSSPPSKWWQFWKRKTSLSVTPSLKKETPVATPKKEETPVATPPPREVSFSSSSLGQMMALRTLLEPLRSEISRMKEQLYQASEPSHVSRLQDQIEELKREFRSWMAEKFYEMKELPSSSQKWIQLWIEKGIPQEHILELIKQVKQRGVFLGNAADPENTILPVLEAMIRRAEEKNGKRIVVLLGPTGVGKTTTIGKLAAFEKLKRKRRVGLLSMDDFKPGGMEQLAHYARILDVPYQSFRSDQTLEVQCRQSIVDTLFIDTFGVSPSDYERLQLLQKRLHFQDKALATSMEIHCVLPVGLSPRDISTTLRSFSLLKPHSLLFTKWDETNHWGSMLSAILLSAKPVSYVCFGQNVPDDMISFSSENFISTVTGTSNAFIPNERGRYATH